MANAGDNGEKGTGETVTVLRGCEKIDKTLDSSIFASTKLNSCGRTFLQNPINSQTLSCLRCFISLSISSAKSA